MPAVAVVFEVWPAEGRRDTYLALAARLKAELSTLDGFVSAEPADSRAAHGGRGAAGLSSAATIRDGRRNPEQRGSMTETADPSTHVVLSGCSGGGKSTLLAELARRGFATVPEPGRRIVEAELRGEGRALPWRDLAAFARRALAMARDDRAAMARTLGWIFFDRGLVDAAAALEHAGGGPARAELRNEPPYHRTVFVTPPWPEIWAQDAERRHGLGEAVAEYERLLAVYGALGYEVVVLPKAGVSERADFVLDRLGSSVTPARDVGAAGG